MDEPKTPQTVDAWAEAVAAVFAGVEEDHRDSVLSAMVLVLSKSFAPHRAAGVLFCVATKLAMQSRLPLTEK